MLQKVIFGRHSMQPTCKSMPGRLFIEPTRLWVYHGKRMSRPKKCHCNLPDEVSLKCNCVKCATHCCPCRERNVHYGIFCKCQANSQCNQCKNPNGVILTKQVWFIQTLRVREVMLTVQLIYGEHL